MKTNSWLYNVAFACIALLMIPNFSYQDYFQVGILTIIGIVLIADIFITLRKYSFYRDEAKYIKSLSKEIRKFYVPMHKYFAEHYKEYPDNSTDIVTVAYRMLLSRTDINVFEYSIYITKGAVSNMPHPHYWLTIFAKWDVNFEYPFIIDVNALRYLADRSIPFDKVMKTYKEKILGVHDKEFKNYRPYTFFVLDTSNSKPIMVANNKKRLVYFANVPESKLPITDYKEIDKIVSEKTSSSIIYIVGKSFSKQSNSQQSDIPTIRSVDNGENN